MLIVIEELNALSLESHNGKRVRIIHALGWYYPDTVGGTEVYVDGLAMGLENCGVSNQIVAPSEKEKPEEYFHNKIPVYRYPVDSNPILKQVRGFEPHGHFEYFKDWLRKQQADIYHQHSWTYGCGLHHLRFAKSLGLKTVLTVHTPSLICARGTMMLYGKEACDGFIQEKRCSQCWAMSKGLPRLLALALANVPTGVSCAAKDQIAFPRFATAVAGRALIQERQKNLREATRLADRVIAVCQWLYDSLLTNGVPAEKLILSRQGIVSHAQLPAACQRTSVEKELKVAFVGRWDEVKGVHVLLEAIRQLPPDIPVKLYIFGTVQSEANAAYRNRVLKAHNDERIIEKKGLSRDQLHRELSKMDLLAVPSQCLETGPLVVLEAFAVGIPVVGSRLGGIAELVRHGVNGWLVPPADTQQWSRALQMFVQDREKLAQLRENLPPVRNMAEVVAEMMDIYKEVCSSLWVQ